jgi:hypothetical protein
VSEAVTFIRRYQGFADGALGGYAAGVAARGIEGPAEANLRALPPLERELRLERDGDRAVLRDGETLVIEVAPMNFELEVPAPATLEDAEAASRNLVHDEYHPFPHCFCCGSHRTQGDGLRLFMGRMPEQETTLAASWTPHPELDTGSELPPEMIWAALDCPTIWASFLQDGRVSVPRGSFQVLARQRVERLAPVRLGEPAIVTAWPISRDGRKHLAGAAIHAPDGQPLARAESLLIEVPRG